MLPINQLEKAAFILKAIGHPVRLQILQLLGEESQMSVQQITQALKTEQSNTSHHLINLKMKGILLSKKEGKKVLYSLKEKEILKIFDCLENCDCNFVS